MIRIALLLAALAALVACGVDGEPERPTADATLAIDGHGDARISMSVNQGLSALFLSL